MIILPKKLVYVGMSKWTFSFQHDLETRTSVCVINLESIDGVISFGVARCKPCDAFDTHEGQRIAFERAIAKFGRDLRTRFWELYWRETGYEKPQPRKVQQCVAHTKQTASTTPSNTPFPSVSVKHNAKRFANLSQSHQLSHASRIQLSSDVD